MLLGNVAFKGHYLAVKYPKSLCIPLESVGGEKFAYWRKTLKRGPTLILTWHITSVAQSQNKLSWGVIYKFVMVKVF